MASHRRSSAAMRSSNQCEDRQAVAALGRGGQAEQFSAGARGRAALGRTAAAAWWNSSTMTTSKWSGRRASRPAAFRLWIEAKTCSNCGRALARRPTSRRRPGPAGRGGRWRGSGRGSPRGGRRRAAGCAGELSRRRRVVDRGHHRLAGARWPTPAGCGGGPAWRARAICSSRRSWNGSGRSSIGLSSTVGPDVPSRCVRSRTRRGRTGRSRRLPVGLEDRATLAITSGLRAPETRTFHSSP